MAKDTERDTDDAQEPFVNEPSELDELTHAELCLMYRKASDSLLFAKSIQWRSVGGAVFVFGAFTAFALFAKLDKSLTTTFMIVTILLACGVIFALLMYQFWQFNEISRIVKIEKNFSSLYIKIRDVKSRREGAVHRYTLLLFMCAMVILGASVVLITLKG
jgi:hypothetical protein